MSSKQVRPAQIGKAAGSKLRYHHIVLTAGIMADQQFPILPPTHHDPYMGVICIEGQVSGLGLRLGNRRTVRVLGGGPATPAQNILAAGDVVENPVHKAGAIQPVGPVGAGGGVASRPHLGKLAPTGVPADHQRLSAPKITDPSNQGKGRLHCVLPGLFQV